MTRPRYNPAATRPCAILLAAAALSLGACGGSSATRPAAQTAGGDVVSTGSVTHRPIRGTGGAAVNDDNPGRSDSGSGAAPGRSNPCGLVSRAEAQAIVRRTVDAPEEGPLGPTCIYTWPGAGHLVTVSVVSADLSAIKRQLRNRSHVQVGGRAAYCGDYGQATTIVPLARGLVLNVTAPCSIGTRFAAVAVSRVKI